MNPKDKDPLFDPDGVDGTGGADKCTCLGGAELYAMLRTCPSSVRRGVRFRLSTLALLLPLLAACGSDVTGGASIEREDCIEDSCSGSGGGDGGGDDPDAYDPDKTYPCKPSDPDPCNGLAEAMGKSAACVKTICQQAGDDPNLGVCEVEDKLDGIDCEDGNKCTVGDACEAGVCGGGLPVKCEWDGDQCHKQECDSGTGECNMPDKGAICDDETKCTFGGDCDEDGECEPGLHIIDTETACFDGNPCTQDYCENGEGCAHKPLVNGAVCQPKDKCHLDEGRCDAGVCVEADKVECGDDGNDCNGKEECDPVKGCISTDPPPENTICGSNDNKCALESWCNFKKCETKKSVDCVDGNPCTDDSCEKSSGKCSNEIHLGECDDGNECTTGDHCALNGQGEVACVPLGKTCDFDE